MAATLAGEILDALIRANLAAGAAILLVLVLRKIARRTVGARVAYGLWLLPPLAGAAVLAPARRIVVAAQTAPPPSITAAFEAAPVGVGAVGTGPLAAVPVQAGLQLDARFLILMAWLMGVAGAALVMAYLQRRFIAEASKGAIGPAVVGVIAPRIVTPVDFNARFSGEEQTLVLAHEHAHIDRQDSRLNGLSAALQCLFWFNPLVHLAAHLMRIDQEMACDEAVVTRFPDARRAYAQALVKAQLAIRPLPLGCYWPSRNEHPLYERIAMLSRDDFSRVRRLTGAIVLAVLCAGAGITAWAAQPANVQIVASPLQNWAPQAPSQPIASAAGAKLPVSGPVVAQIPNQAALEPTAPARNDAAVETRAPAAPTPEDITRLRAEQEAPQQLVPFDPTHFDKYVGYYELAPNFIFKVTRDGTKFYDQLTGQRVVELYPESETKFFETVVAAQLSFVIDKGGNVTGLILHQNGREQAASRITEDAAQDLESSLANRIKSNMPSPGTEEATRRWFVALENGQPDYEHMMPSLAEAAREQWPGTNQQIKTFGPLKSVAFLRVDARGNDVYQVDFEHSRVTETIAPLMPDGKVATQFWNAQPILDEAEKAALAQRIKDNKPSSGTEAYLRNYLTSASKGRPDYSGHSAGLESVARAQWPTRGPVILARGALKSLTFLRVSPEGYDVYDAVYEHSELVWTVAPLGPDGKESYALGVPLPGSN
jgi:beta-lactamase regulating signal transducer with metallopeptidase domain